MTRFMLLLVAGLVSAQAAGFQIPRYRLAPGTILWYTGESETKNPRGSSRNTRLREHWVLSDSGGVFRVLLRVVDQNYKTDTAGNRTDQPSQTDWELFEMTTDGRLLRDQSTVNVDVSALFPPLPADSAAAVSGWRHKDTLVGSEDFYRLDNKSPSDSLWLVDHTQSSPLDVVYGAPASEARIVVDTRRGLPLRRDGRSADTASGRESQASIRLDSVTKFDPANLPRQLLDMASYFDTRQAYDEESDKSDPEDTSGVADKRALAVLQDALGRTQDSTVITLLNDDIKRHEQAAAYSLSRLRTRLQWRGKPAPDWKLSDLSGRRHSLSDYRGKVVILDWWYKDCPWCILAMPALSEVARRYADRPVSVLGMNVDRDSADARFAVDKVKPGYLSLLAGRDVAKEYGVTGYPTLFVIDKQGRVADVHTGYSKDLTTLLSKKLDALLGP
jgi:thiol-disulfide isomerase/thioredoxin